jgi:hypothetical protein
VRYERLKPETILIFHLTELVGSVEESTRVVGVRMRDMRGAAHRRGMRGGAA